MKKRKNIDLNKHYEKQNKGFRLIKLCNNYTDNDYYEIK